jgi:methylphosphotriester-DNA--protein-cysteine methyltransferase
MKNLLSTASAALNEGDGHLRNGESVTETAYKLGFNSIGAFSVAFSNLTGTSPSAFVRGQSIHAMM